ncbi:cellulase family glycosylhydrolase [Sphingobium sp. CECT 9361]|uniref:glycoside hydrolase family 5 protein n=1 Tax=Sphingobium sp. CECT 9361 TaxID=2845384 RepID=UPI001E59E43C|nr:cellulase family glycosylhydrolase [Sphingobium sp. CECT 9361]CAH0356904.1 hypothetical protein SPH9361_04550 [Sphingobium sp. CECT 9361]
MNSSRKVARRLFLAGLLSIAACGAPELAPAQPSPARTLMANPRAVSNSALAIATLPVRGESTYVVTADQTTDTLLRLVASYGVGLIRLVTNPMPLLTDDNSARSASMTQVLKVVDTMRASGFRVVVDFHNWPPGNPAEQSAAMVNNAGQRARLSRALVEMAGRLKRMPAGSVGLELLNEPACKLMRDVKWPELQAQLYRLLRREAPVLPLVLKGCNDGKADLMQLDVRVYSEDPNAIFSFHFYEPFIFTHQATYYRGSAFRGVPFPAMPDRSTPDSGSHLADYFAIPAGQIKPESVTELKAYLRDGPGPGWYAREISQVGVWADRQGIARGRILLGEFGMTLKAGPDARKILPDIVRWLQMISQTSQREGFAYALWPPVRPSGPYIDPATNFLRQDVAHAVGWRP